MSPETTAPAPIVYPESDGKPMADNTRQFEWIMRLAGNLQALYADDENVFVGGDLLWYPVEGDPNTRYAPDAFVVFGRPRGHRGSYRQWEENNVPMTVAFEVLSPANTAEEMADKLLAYDEYGVEEYYVLDPEANKLEAYRRGQATLVKVRFDREYVSSRLGIRFKVSEDQVEVFYPDGEAFLTFAELQKKKQQAQERADKAEKDKAEAAKLATEAKNEAIVASERATRAQKEATDANDRAARAEKKEADANRRMARVAELSLKLLRGQASTEEIRELETLSQSTA